MRIQARAVMAGGTMAFSSLAVVLNSSRLTRWRASPPR